MQYLCDNLVFFASRQHQGILVHVRVTIQLTAFKFLKSTNKEKEWWANISAHKKNKDNLYQTRGEDACIKCNERKKMQQLSWYTIIIIQNVHYVQLAD